MFRPEQPGWAPLRVGHPKHQMQKLAVYFFKKNLASEVLAIVIRDGSVCKQWPHETVIALRGPGPESRGLKEKKTFWDRGCCVLPKPTRSAIPAQGLRKKHVCLTANVRMYNAQPNMGGPQNRYLDQVILKCVLLQEYYGCCYRVR
jgi:hypothetical protein